jgi:hypothetical protein
MLATQTRPMDWLSPLDWHAVRAHYEQRLRIHQHLVAWYNQRSIRQFVRLLLGITDPAANYSASDHGLGPRILHENADAEQRIFLLAGQFAALTRTRRVPELITATNLSSLKIGVGSEISCLMNPTVCWVANTRTIWAYLVEKWGDVHQANVELKAYRDEDSTSEMKYAEWAEMHRLLETSMTRIATDGTRRATAARVRPGQIRYLWADAIANALYEEHHQ